MGFGVTLGGQPLVQRALGSRPAYTVYGADVSAFAGMELELRFISYPVEDIPGYAINNVYSDGIHFSSLPLRVPLSIAATPTNTVVLSWPAPTNFFAARQSLGLVTNDWLTVTNMPVEKESGSQLILQRPEVPTFFRLISQ